jgi:hypothetical protein
MFELLALVVIASAIWVFFDAPTIGESRYTWSIGMLLLWIVGFPWYLSVRSRKVRAGWQPAPAAETTRDPVATELDRLAHLRDTGGLTDAQYERQRRQALGRGTST